MNSSRYIFARFALSCGVHKKTKRLTEAASEMHLLLQAEEILGEDVWEQVEELEELNIGYWTLRKNQLVLTKLEEQLAEADLLLTNAQEERNSILNHTNEACKILEETRDLLLKDSEQLRLKRDEVISRAQQIKKRFKSSQTKISVLGSQDTVGYGSDNKSAIEEEQQSIEEYKNRFIKLKKERAEIGAQLSGFDDQIAKIDQEIAADKEEANDRLAAASQTLSKMNRDKSKLSADIGLIAEENKPYLAEIGRYVSSNEGVDPICKKIFKERSNLISQIQMLRTSIALNHKLASLAN